MSGRTGTRQDLQALKEAADKAEREAMVALNALFIATDARVAADVKEKVVAAFRANADFFMACAASGEAK